MKAIPRNPSQPIEHRRHGCAMWRFSLRVSVRPGGKEPSGAQSWHLGRRTLLSFWLSARDQAPDNANPMRLCPCHSMLLMRPNTTQLCLRVLGSEVCTGWELCDSHTHASVEEAVTGTEFNNFRNCNFFPGPRQIH